MTRRVPYGGAEAAARLRSDFIDPIERPRAVECVNCGVTGGHADVCVHHPAIQARLRRPAP